MKNLASTIIVSSLAAFPWVTAAGFFTLVALGLLLLRRKLQPLGMARRITDLAWEASGIQTFARSLPQFNIELDSSRRYQKTLSIAVVQLFGDEKGATKESARSNGNGNHAAMWGLSQWDVIRLVLPLVASLLQESLRSSDKVSYDQARAEYIILFTETKKAQAGEAVKRFTISMAAKSQIRTRTGLAEFPTDGLILADLIELARAEASAQGDPARASLVPAAVTVSGNDTLGSSN
jgi:hypothetical protein